MAKQSNDGVHIVRIIDLVECEKHHAPLHIPCFTLRKGQGNGYYPAICNDRAVAAGANGSVSETAVQMNRKRFPSNKRKFSKTQAA